MDAIDAIVAGTHDIEDNSTEWEIDDIDGGSGEVAFARAGPQTITVRAPQGESRAWVAVHHDHGIDPDRSGQMAHEWVNTLEEAVAAVREFAQNRYQYWPDPV